jgi:hypothetical protein
MTASEANDRIRRGMTHEEVAELLGEEGEIVSGHGAQIEPGIPVGVMTTQVREWRFEDAVLRVMFGDGKVRETVELGTDSREEKAEE